MSLRVRVRPALRRSKLTGNRGRGERQRNYHHRHLTKSHAHERNLPSSKLVKRPGDPLENEPDRLRSAIPKTNGSQLLDLQRDTLGMADIGAVNVYHDLASGLHRDERPGLDGCLCAMRKGDVLVGWKVDSLGRNLRPCDQ